MHELHDLETFYDLIILVERKWQSVSKATRKLNKVDLQSRVQNCIGSWRSGKFMPLVFRSFSTNTYCLSKVWFRTGSIDLRVGDIKAITSKVKS